ncbi:hypothetical protein T4C_9199 [Trichinella pseudospiralis]|uniref:Uncharacterized protein n=1 Tax=Trichinella pseudospiralis TaxID=6337 RepID=A0A0V1JPL5_TRIPS|nr:hypothetical protein T4C_9199 [Trichinella pseudospiralis]
MASALTVTTSANARKQTSGHEDYDARGAPEQHIDAVSKAVTAARIGHVGKRAPLPGIATHTPDTKTHEMNRGLWMLVDETL